MSCEHCNGSGEEAFGNGGEKCCWAIAKEIQNFKKRVFRIYIMETLFDMIVSLASVVIDIVILIHYARHGKWMLTVLTGLPVLLPTIVFTNIYMSDVSRGYCKMPKHRLKKQTSKDEKIKKESGRFLSRIERKTQISRVGCLSCFACWSGILHSLFHKDRHVRKRGAKLALKTMRRGFKYVYGTLVLRIIAWTWYLKALIFGLKAHRNPQKFMHIEPPDTHWSRDLLVRLDFFQAALENAPQCIIQLYALLSEPGENVGLGVSALILSFIDFIRVATTVLWNVNKGPVEAPENCYGTLIWQLMNICSWIFLYVARCSAIGLIISIVKGVKDGTVTVPILIFILHVTIFAVLVSRLKAGQASEKLAVTTFISIFFLPDLDSTNVHVMIQFYYGMILIENTLFIVPWGWDLGFTGFCFAVLHNSTISPITTAAPVEFGAITLNPDASQASLPLAGDMNFERQGIRSSGGNIYDSDCLIDPIIVVLFVPSFTIIGVVLRLAASKRMSHFKSIQPETSDDAPFLMEERIASIYNRKWTKMTVRQVWDAVVHMLIKEVVIQGQGSTTQFTEFILQEKPNELTTIDTRIYQEDEKSEFQIYRQRSFSVGNIESYDSPREIHYGGGGTVEFGNWTGGMKSMDDSGIKKNDGTTIPPQFFYPASVGNIRKGYSQNPDFGRNLDVRFLKVETQENVHVFETIHI